MAAENEIYVVDCSKQLATQARDQCVGCPPPRGAQEVFDRMASTSKTAISVLPVPWFDVHVLVVVQA